MGYTEASVAVTTGTGAILTVKPGSNRGVAVFGYSVGGTDSGTFAGRYRLARATGGASASAVTVEKTNSRTAATDVTGADSWGTDPTVSGNSVISMAKVASTTNPSTRRWVAPNPRYPICEEPSGAILDVLDSIAGGIDQARQISWGEPDAAGLAGAGRYRGRRARTAAGFYIQDEVRGFHGTSTTHKGMPGASGYCFLNALDWPTGVNSSLATFLNLLNGNGNQDLDCPSPASSWGEAGALAASGAVALSGSSSASTWGEAGALTGAAAVALAGTSSSSAWGEAGTLAAVSAALAGSSSSSAWGEAGTLAASGAAALAVAPSLSTWGEAGTFTGAGAVALSGTASSSTWGEAGTLAALSAALTGTAPFSTWGQDGTLSIAGGPQALSGSAASSTWGHAGTLAAVSAALSGTAPVSTWGQSGTLAGSGAVALSGASPSSTWGLAGTLSVVTAAAVSFVRAGFARYTPGMRFRGQKVPSRFKKRRNE
jgi:hypothetical protein